MYRHLRIPENASSSEHIVSSLLVIKTLYGLQVNLFTVVIETWGVLRTVSPSGNAGNSLGSASIIQSMTFTDDLVLSQSPYKYSRNQGASQVLNILHLPCPVSCLNISSGVFGCKFLG